MKVCTPDMLLVAAGSALVAFLWLMISVLPETDADEEQARQLANLARTDRTDAQSRRPGL